MHECYKLLILVQWKVIARQHDGIIICNIDVNCQGTKRPLCQFGSSTTNHVGGFCRQHNIFAVL